MIDIKQAIEKSKEMPNVSNGGSKCFDFGDVVLVKYVQSIKYLKENEHVRNNEESIKEALDEKIKNGVNVPKHIAIERVIEGENEICYVLQEKCKGINCAEISKYGVSYEELCESLNFVNNIPFEHYKKLIIDGCNLFEMGYEAKNKNLFYDKDTGFWYIDFLENNKEYTFDVNNVKKIFEALRYRMPSPLNIASSMNYNADLTEEQVKKVELLKNSIRTKFYLATKAVIPNIERYEKFYLFWEGESFRKFLMSQNIVKKNLLTLEDSDYEIYDELYSSIINELVNSVVNLGNSYWNIEVNDFRNNCRLFSLNKVWQFHRENTLKSQDFEDKYDYEYEVNKQFTNKAMKDIYEKLKEYEPNNNINLYIEEYLKRQQVNKFEL